MPVNNIHLKVCGMRDPLNIAEVGALDPDYMGFIFYRGSKRFVGEDFLVPDELSTAIKRVGVFVNEDTDVMLRVARNNRLDYLQLHGQESVDQCARVSGEGLAVIKTFNVDSMFDFAVTSKYVGVTDFFLFDTKGSLPGGNGSSFDWSYLKSYNQEVPFFLSGGISADNIQSIESLKGMNIHAVDVNSGVERSPALKDITLLIELTNKMKAYAI